MYYFILSIVLEINSFFYAVNPISVGFIDNSKMRRCAGKTEFLSGNSEKR